jgi:hypothetical protein
MDKYTLMCSKLTQLQEGWKPKVGDKVWRKYTIFGEEIDKTIWKDDNQRMEIIILTFKSSCEGYFHATNKNGDERIFKTPEDLYKSTCIYLPSLEDLIEMLEGIEFRLLHFQGYGDKKEWHFGWQARFEFTESNNWRDMQLYGDTSKEAFLKLVAYEKWGLVWSEEKETWEDNNDI